MSPTFIELGYMGTNIFNCMLLPSFNLAVAAEWQRAAKNVCGIEMELAGVYHAVHDSESDPRLISIRGLSDIVGYRRDEGWTEFACHSSASFAAALIMSGICTN